MSRRTIPNYTTKSFTYKGIIYSLEKRNDNFFLIRKNGQSLKIVTNQAGAEEEFRLLEETLQKGGETDMGEGEKKAREVADKLRAEKEAAAEENKLAKQDVQNQLAALAENPELAALYKQNAKLGAENIGGSAPYLRIHTANSTANELPDGTVPKDGNFFYAPTKEEFSEITCHILTMSKGFRVIQEDKKNGSKRLQYNEIVGGTIVDQGEFKPFLMYINGLKCQPLWKLKKEIGEYIRTQIPMFAIVVRVTTEQVKSDYGFKWVPKFEIVKQGNMPEIVLDVTTFNMLKDGVLKTEAMINQLIQANAAEDTVNILSPNDDGGEVPLPTEKV